MLALSTAGAFAIYSACFIAISVCVMQMLRAYLDFSSVRHLKRQLDKWDDLFGKLSGMVNEMGNSLDRINNRMDRPE
jgi:hypothetical protein